MTDENNEITFQNLGRFTLSGIIPTIFYFLFLKNVSDNDWKSFWGIILSFSSVSIDRLLKMLMIMYYEYKKNKALSDSEKIIHAAINDKDLPKTDRENFKVELGKIKKKMYSNKLDEVSRYSDRIQNIDK